MTGLPPPPLAFLPFRFFTQKNNVALSSFSVSSFFPRLPPPFIFLPHTRPLFYFKQPFRTPGGQSRCIPPLARASDGRFAGRGFLALAPKPDRRTKRKGRRGGGVEKEEEGDEDPRAASALGRNPWGRKGRRTRGRACCAPSPILLLRRPPPGGPLGAFSAVAQGGYRDKGGRLRCCGSLKPACVRVGLPGSFMPALTLLGALPLGLRHLRVLALPPSASGRRGLPVARRRGLRARGRLRRRLLQVVKVPGIARFCRRPLRAED